MKHGDLDELVAALPHAPPFRFVNRVKALRQAESVHGVWIVSGEEEFFKGHFPGHALVPGVLIIEALAQASGVLASASMDKHSTVQGRLAHCDVRFMREISPPAEIDLISTVSRVLGKLHQFNVEAHINDQVAARGTIALALSESDGEATRS